MEYTDAFIGNEIHECWGAKVIEHTRANGTILALKVKSKDTLTRSEADLMHYAATHGIRAPKVYGVYDVETSPRMRVMVSDRVPGVPLSDVWETATEQEKASYKDQLREQLALMRECTQPFIGGVTKAGDPQPTHNIYDRALMKNCGPFDNEEEFDAWCLARAMPHIGLLMRRKWTRFIERERRNGSGRFVLTHGDLSPRNIMAQDGVITGIIDWGRGGFFPEYAEYAFAMALGHCIEEWWLPVLREILQPCSKDRLKFTTLVEFDIFKPMRIPRSCGLF